MNHLVTIIVPTYDNLGYLKRALGSVERNTLLSYELVVVDNASSGGTEEYLRGKEVTVIRNERNLGFARAVNQGICRARGNYLVLLSDDVDVTKGWLKGLVACAESDKKIGVVGGKLLSPDNIVRSAGAYMRPEVLSTASYGYGVHRNHPSVNVEYDVEYVCGACMLIKREVIDKIGLLDENFFIYFEDLDICYRAWLAGYRVVYTPKCEVYQHEHKTINRLPDRDKIIHESRIYFFRKWGFLR